MLGWDEGGVGQGLVGPENRLPQVDVDKAAQRPALHMRPLLHGVCPQSTLPSPPQNPSSYPGKYFEGVSDLPGQDISREGEPHVLWVDPLSTLSTMQHDLSVDRGLPFAAATAQLARATDGASGFMVSKRPSFGRTSYILALQKARTPGTFSIARPNTGMPWSGG